MPGTPRLIRRWGAGELGSWEDGEMGSWGAGAGEMGNMFEV
ncbi:hypothetical protein [Moorena sp. SIO1F2]|nr:hypothetical protein [Moorena sp. SIO1F2]